MAERVIAPATYSLVFLALIALTVLTVAVSFVHIEGVWHIGIGLLIGGVKAALVVLFFMHALFSDKVTKMVILVSIFWAGILLVLTLSDYFSRGLVPFMPGHWEDPPVKYLLGEHSPLIALGMTSLVLGVIGLLLFFLPILGVPLSAFGMFFGLLGLGFAFVSAQTSLRWSVGGVAVSALALAVNLTILYAPGGYLPPRRVPQLWQQPPGRPYVPPPAAPPQTLYHD